MSGFSGADVAQLRALSSRINTQSEKLREIATSSTVALMAAEWTGNDIDAVRSNWRRGSLPTINALAGALREMGAELDKHAAEQERVSGGNSGSWLDGIRDLIGNWFERFLVPIIPPIFGFGGAKDGAEAPHNGDGPYDQPQQEPSDEKPVVVPRLAEPGGSESGYQAWLAGGRHHPTYGFVDPMGSAANNCTSWVSYRRDQMDLPLASPPGYGYEMAGKVGGAPNGEPQPGSIVSYGSYPGHVMFVEEVISTDPKSFRISEMNILGMPDGSTREATWTQNTDGTWSDDQGRSEKQLIISTGRG